MIPVVPMASVLDILLPVAVTQIVMHWATAAVTLMKCVLQVGNGFDRGMLFMVSVSVWMCSPEIWIQSSYLCY